MCLVEVAVQPVMSVQDEQSVKVGTGMACGVESHSTLLYKVPHSSLLSKPLLVDSGQEREETERREVQQSFLELRDLSVERSCTCHFIGKSFLGTG